MYVNNIEPEMVLPPGSESFNHNATRTTSSRSRSYNVNNNTVCVYIMLGLGFSDIILRHFLALLSMFSELEHIYPQSLSINLGTQIGQKKKGTHALSLSFQKGPS